MNDKILKAVLKLVLGVVLNLGLGTGGQVLDLGPKGHVLFHNIVENSRKDDLPVVEYGHTVLPCNRATYAECSLNKRSNTCTEQS